MLQMGNGGVDFSIENMSHFDNYENHVPWLNSDGPLKSKVSKFFLSGTIRVIPRWGCNHPPPSKNRVFSAPTHPLDPRPVCKLKFVICGPVEKNRALYLSRFSRGGPTKFESTFFQIAKLRFLRIFVKIIKFSKQSQGLSLKAHDLKFWNLALTLSYKNTSKIQN